MYKNKKNEKKSNSNFTFTFLYEKIYILLQNTFGKA